MQQQNDAVFCAKVLRHAAVGAIIGGPLAGAVIWYASERTPALDLQAAQMAGSSVLFIVALAAILLGVWIGATISCSFLRALTHEERCYGGAVGCLVYLVGGLLGLLIGVRVLDSALHPILLYMIGATTLGLVALIFTLACPRARAARGQGEDEGPPE